MGKDLTLPVLRSRSRCGVLGCLSAVAQAFPPHSFCPLPASAHSTVRSFHASSNWGLDCLLQNCDSKEIGRIKVDPEVLRLLPWLWVYQFLWQQEHIKSKATIGRLPSPCLNSKAFPQAARAQVEYSLTPSLCDAALHVSRMSMWYPVEGGEWNFVNYFIGDKDMHSNLLFILICLGSK